MRVCEKEGCVQPARMFVSLMTGDDAQEWWACLEHAHAFRDWVIEESRRIGEPVNLYERVPGVTEMQELSGS